MKGVFTDAEEWEFVVNGDWRRPNGKSVEVVPYDESSVEVVPYDESKGWKGVIISGAVGFYHYLRGEWNQAIHEWFKELDIIKEIEKEENRRMHKGWFYYQLAMAYGRLGDTEDAGRYLGLAVEEDRLSYGEQAKNFPAAKLLAKIAEDANE